MQVRYQALKINFPGLTEADYEREIKADRIINSGNFNFKLTLIFSIAFILLHLYFYTFIGKWEVFLFGALCLSVLFGWQIREKRKIRRTLKSLNPRHRVILALFPLLQDFNNDIDVVIEIKSDDELARKMLDVAQQWLQIRREKIFELYGWYELGGRDEDILNGVKTYDDIVGLISWPL